MLKGHDIASAQADFVPPAGDAFLFVKATEGHSYINPKHDAQVARGRAKGLVIGHYHYLWPRNIAVQARYFVQHAKAKPGDVLIVDWETPKGSPSATPSEALKFVQQIRALAPGLKILGYMNLSFRARLNGKKLGDAHWIAYPGTKEPSGDWLFWQCHFGEIQTDGTGNDPVDWSKAKFASKAELVAWAGGTPEKKPAAPALPVGTVTTLKGTPLASDVVWDEKAKVKFRGGWTCSCTTQVIGLAEALLIERGFLKECLDFWQLGYNAGGVAQSAGTHDKGGVADAKQYAEAYVLAIREAGGFGWERGPEARLGGMSPRHCHFGVLGCPHQSAPLAQQERDYRAGRNGLANKGADYGPKAPIRTYKQAIAALTKKVGDPAPKPAPAPTEPEGDDLDMAEHLTKTRTKGQTFPKANAYDWLRLDDKGNVSFLCQPGKIIGGYLDIVISGIGPSDSVFLFPAAYDVIQAKGRKKGKATKRSSDEGHPIKIDGSANGKTRARIPFDWVLGDQAKGYGYRALRFRVCASSTKARIERLDVSGWYVPTK